MSTWRRRWALDSFMALATVRVNPNEIVDIVVRFEDFAGGFMDH